MPIKKINKKTAHQLKWLYKIQDENNTTTTITNIFPRLHIDEKENRKRK